MMDAEQLEQLKAAAMKAPQGPWFVEFDHALDCPNHKESGLAMVETRRSNDWWIARLTEWPIAQYIAKADPTTILDLIAEVERLREVWETCAQLAEKDAQEWKLVSTNYLASDPMKTKAVSRAAMASEIAIAIRARHDGEVLR